MYKNILANLISRIWSLISIFIFIPLYIHFLGIELYGLVSFFATMQSVLFLLDAGLSATLRREFSFGESNLENSIRRYKLLRSIEFCYLIITSTTIILCFLGAEFIVNKWLNIGNINPSIAITTIRLMGVSIALQFLSTLYYGGLLGLQKQVITNIYQIGWSLLKNGCVLLILWLITPDIRLFYIWFIFTDLLYLALLRIKIYRSLSIDNKYSWNFKELNNLKNIWKYASGILTISIISAFNFQLDKIAISKFLPISDLGTYNLAFSLSQIPVILVNAISIAIFPRFVNYYSTNESQKLQSLFTFANKILGIFAICVSISICFYAQELFVFWTRNPELSSNAWLPATILTIGSLFLALQIIPFNLALAHGVTIINTVYGLINISVLIPLLLILIKSYGIIGAALSWFLILLIFTPFYNCYIYNKFINNNWLKWFLKDTIFPLFFVFVLSTIFYIVGTLSNLNSSYVIIYAIFTGMAVLTLTIYIFNKNIFSKIKQEIEMHKIIN